MQNFYQRLYPYRWLFAFVISILLHLALLGGARLDWPDFSSSPVIIEAELVKSPPPLPPPPPKPKPPKKPTQAKPAKPVAAPAPKPVPPSANPVATPSPVATQTVAPVPAPEMQSGVDLDTSYVFEETPSLPPPKWVETDFDVKRIGFGSGVARYRYQTDNGHYVLSSEMEASGLASLAFSGKRVEKSQGLVTAQGLQPQQYRYDLTGKPDKFQQADFDWTAKKLTLKSAKDEQSFPLEQGTQDFLSFIYQFMFVGPLDVMQYTLTNGKYVRHYEYHFLGEEKLNTKLGELNTLHIAKSSGDPDEKTEVWLASDYRYIPVKIIKIAKDGTGYEFLVSRISADFNHEHRP